MMLVPPTELEEAEHLLYELGKGIDVDAFLSTVRELMEASRYVGIWVGRGSLVRG